VNLTITLDPQLSKCGFSDFLIGVRGEHDTIAIIELVLELNPVEKKL